MTSWGCRRMPPRGDQERLPAARQEAASGRQQDRQDGGDEVRRAERGLRNPRRRGQAQGVRPRRDRRRGQAALPGLSAGGGGRGPWGAGGGAGQDSNFETFTWGPDGFQRGGGGGRARRRSRRRRHRRHPRRRCSAARRGGGRRAQFEHGGFRRRGRRAATSPAPSPSRCRRLLTGTSRRVHLPTGKEIDAKIPAGSRRRPDHPAEGAGAARPRRRRRRRADHGHDRRASAVQARRREPAARTAGHAL